MYRDCTSYADQLLCVGDLVTTAEQLRADLGYSDADARSVALDNVGVIAKSGLMALHLLHRWSSDPTLAQVIPHLVGLKSPTPQGAKNAAQLFDKTQRLSLVLLGQFQIEHLLRNVARNLELPTDRGFYVIAKSVLDRAGLPANRMDVLNTPARIRNSLHTNGVHHQHHSGEPAVVYIKGVAYEFRDGQRVLCASWQHIAHALESSIGVLKELLATPEVLAIADPMPEDYSRTQGVLPGGAL